jgi:hypothetical protein
LQATGPRKPVFNPPALSILRESAAGQPGGAMGDRTMGTLQKAGLALVMLGVVAGCARPFDYAAASVEDQRAWLESASQGIYDGLAKTIPHGKGGVYMRMGERKVDPARRRIEIVVNVQADEDTPSLSGMTSSALLRGLCPSYLGTDFERNDVTIYIRFAMPGGGSAAAVSATRSSCARYAKPA